LKEKSTVNVNILTHLEYYRVQKLIDEGKSLKNAKKQAQSEILSVFGISGDFENSEDMSIFGTTDGDAALLAISILLQGNLSEAQFTERLTDFSLGFRETGVWSNKSAKDAMADWAAMANLQSIRNYILGWGLSSTVPDFEKYIRAYWYSNYGIDKVCDAGSANTTVNSNRDVEFMCRDNFWQLGSKYTEFDRDTFGWGSTCVAGDIRQGNVSDKKYICQNSAWKVATDYQLDVGGLGNCSTEGVLKDGLVSGKKYVCEGSNWKLASTDVGFGPCTAANQGKVVSNGTEGYYTCDSNVWRKATYREKKCSISECLTFTDTRDKQSYDYVKIGEQTWMAENLNYAADDSKCYKNEPANCDLYGRLYDWATAMGIDAKYNTEKWDGSDAKHKGICPSGWHIPSDADWNVLMKRVNPSCSDNSNCDGAGTKLKAREGWNSYSGVPAGTDEFGFSALPGGDGYSGGNFDNAGNSGDWWSASELNSDDAYSRNMHYNYENVDYINYYKSYLFSVRCVQD